MVFPEVLQRRTDKIVPQPHPVLDRTAYLSLELVHRERLLDVHVGALFEPLDLNRLVYLCGEENDRNVRIGRIVLDPFAQFQSIDPGHHDI